MEAAKEALRKEGETFIDGRGDRTTEEGRIAIYTDVEKRPRRNDRVAGRIGARRQGQRRRRGTWPTTWPSNWRPAPARRRPMNCGSSPPRASRAKRSRKSATRSSIASARCFACRASCDIDAPCGGYVHHDAKSGVLLEVEGGNARTCEGHQHARRGDEAPSGHQGRTRSGDRRGREGRSKSIGLAQEGKPENIIEKMIEGRMRNFYAEIVLLKSNHL